MKKLLTSDTAWKIYSVLIAILLWCAVMFTQNPETSRWIRGVPVRILNQETLEQAGFYLVNDEPLKVDVKISGRLLYVIKAEAITVTGEIDAETNTCRLAPVPSNGIMVQDIKKEISVDLEKEGTTLCPLQAEFAEDITEEERKLVEAQFETESVKITGPSSKVKQIAGAYVRIEKADLSEGNFGKMLYKDLIVKNGDGQTLDMNAARLSAENKQFGVRLIQLEKREVPIEVVMQGEPAQGYQVLSAESEPAKVHVVATSDAKEVIDVIYTAQVDIEGLKSDKRKSKIQLEIPAGYVLLHEKESEVDVVLKIEQESAE